MTYVISGGFGDCINQIAKIKELNADGDDPNIIYIRDSVDEQILNQANPLTRGYATWVSKICKAQGWNCEIVVGDQKQLCEQFFREHPGWIILGPNMDYSLKIWEPHRGLFVGVRPHEKEYVVNRRVNFYMGDCNEIHNGCECNCPCNYQKQGKNVVIQVRFGNEYPTKFPNACWKDVKELMSIIKKVQEWGSSDIVLVGETKQNISALEKAEGISYFVNDSVIHQYNRVLNADYCIGFSGWFSNVASLNGIKTLRMFWDPAETKLQIPPFAYEHITHFDHGDLDIKLKQFLQ